MERRKWYIWSDPIDQVSYTNDPRRRRGLVLRSIDLQSFGWLVVIVAGLGFLTAAYDIFAVNTVIPMLVYVYGADINDGFRIPALNIATLGGSMIGQVAFGIWADIVGRRKVYGLELIITITATICVAMAADGASSSMDIFGWLFFWRLVMGIGIGVEYPLSAVIASESAPTMYRARMLAVVFAAQPVGQFIASVVAVLATLGFRNSISSGSVAGVDRTWRLITGLGAVPAAFAIGFRLRIPESARYYLEIENNSIKAESSVREQYNLGPSDFGPETEMHGQGVAPNVPGEMQEVSNTATNGVFGPDPDGITPAATHQTTETGPQNEDQAPLVSPSAYAPQQYRARDDPPAARKLSWTEFKRYLIEDGGLFILFGTSFSWFCNDFSFYGLGLSVPKLISLIKYDTGNYDSNLDYDYFLDDATNSMLAVSVGALIGSTLMIALVNKQTRKSLQTWGFIRLGFAFVILGAAFDRLAQKAIWPLLMIAYFIIQAFFNWGPNTTTFILPAEIFPTPFRCTCHGISAAVGKLGSILAQIFLYSVSFPYYGKVSYGSVRLPACTTTSPGRTSSTGPPCSTVTSAASSPIDDSKAFGYVLIIFASFMFLGAFTTWYFIPETQPPSTRADLTLENLHPAAEELSAARQEGALRWTGLYQ